MHTQKNSKNILQPATIDHEVHGVPKLQLAYQSHENGSWGNTPKNLDIVIILGVFKQINPKLVFFSWFINMFHPYFPLQMLYDFALSCLFLPFPHLHFSRYQSPHCFDVLDRTWRWSAAAHPLWPFCRHRLVHKHGTIPRKNTMNCIMNI